MKINIIGAFLGGDGYSSHTRQLANAIQDEGVEVVVSTNLQQGFEKMVSQKELKMLTGDRNNIDANLIIGLPNFWLSHTLNDKPTIGFLVWEGDSIPKQWIEILADKNIAQIWVPSTHVQTAISNTTNDSNILNKIKIVPHGVDPKLFRPYYNPEKTKDKLTFISSGGWPNGVLDRKGLSYLIKAYLEEFTGKDKVELIVKINTSYGMSAELLDANMKQLNLTNKLMPTLKFVTEMVPMNEVYKFYSLGDVYITTSMAEGFNLPCLEAMACGLPVISTDFGGMTDFVNEDNGWLLKDGVMKTVTWDRMYEGIKWKIPSVKEIRKVLRSIYNKQESIGQKVSNIVIDKHTWKETAIKAKEFIGLVV